MIELRTGLPGSGKTLSAIETAIAYSKEGRRVYMLGFNGIDYAATGTLPYEHRIDEWQSVLQPGDVLMVDECQRYLPKTLCTRGKPKWVEEFAVNRHSGVDLLFITQDVRNIDPYTASLVNTHRHYVNRYGAPQSRVYLWTDGVHDARKATDKRLAERSKWKYPEKLYTFYKSAELHTRKKSTPKAFRWLVFGALAFVVFGLVAGFALWRMSSAASKADSSSASSADHSSSSLGGLLGSGSSSREPKKLTKAEWLTRMVPRIDGVPWSAPLFDDRKAEAQPEVYCMSVDDGRCKCHSEQGTDIHMTGDQCKDIALHGLYNPFRRSYASNERDRREVEPESRPRAIVEPVPADAVVPVGRAAPQAEASHHRVLSAAFDASQMAPRSGQY